MIQPMQMATQGSSRNSKNLHSLSLILVRSRINKTDVPFHCTRQREIAAIIWLSYSWDKSSSKPQQRRSYGKVNALRFHM